MSFATPYIGRRDMHCWQLVCAIYEQHCGISLPAYGDVDAEELVAVARAVEEGRSHSSTWARVEPFPGAEQPFDVVVMQGWLADSTGARRRGTIHTGVVTHKGHVAHTDLGYAVVAVPLGHPTVKRRLVGCYRHALIGGACGRTAAQG